MSNNRRALWRISGILILALALFALVGCSVPIPIPYEPTPQPEPTAVEPTATPVPPTPKPTPTPAPSTAAEAGGQAETSATAQEASCQVTATRGLRVRSGPGTSFPTIAVLKHQAVFTPTGRNDAGDWVALVNSNGVSGWVSTDWVDCTVDVMSLSVSGG